MWWSDVLANHVAPNLTSAFPFSPPRNLTSPPPKLQSSTHLSAPTHPRCQHSQPQPVHSRAHGQHTNCPPCAPAPRWAATPAPSPRSRFHHPSIVLSRAWAVRRRRHGSPASRSTGASLGMKAGRRCFNTSWWAPWERWVRWGQRQLCKVGFTLYGMVQAMHRLNMKSIARIEGREGQLRAWWHWRYRALVWTQLLINEFCRFPRQYVRIRRCARSS